MSSQATGPSPTERAASRSRPSRRSGWCSATSARARSTPSRRCSTHRAASRRGGDPRAVSLIIWTLIIITTVKYVNFAMRIDNDGEGGILALMTLLGVKRHQRPLIIAVGLFGAALIYGDGAITPAISVLSALEGMDRSRRACAYVLPAATVILLALFAISRSARRHRPRVRPDHAALVRRHRGARRLRRHAASSVWLRSIRSTASPICRAAACRASWCSAASSCASPAPRRCTPTWAISARADPPRLERVVFPGLILNYAGQAAIVLAGAPTDGNIFYRLCPRRC